MLGVALQVCSGNGGNGILIVVCCLFIPSDQMESLYSPLIMGGEGDHGPPTDCLLAGFRSVLAFILCPPPPSSAPPSSVPPSSVPPPYSVFYPCSIRVSFIHPVFPPSCLLPSPVFHPLSVGPLSRYSSPSGGQRS